MNTRYTGILFKVSWKNVWRSKVRSGAVITAVGVGLWAGIFVSAFSYGISDQRLHGIINSQIAHLQIHFPEFTDNMETPLLIENGEDITAHLTKDERIKGISGRLISTGMIASTTTGAGVIVKGIHPSEETRVTNVFEKLVDGEFLSSEKRNQIIIGEKLADKLKVKLRSKIVISMQDVNGNIVSGAFRIEGIYKTNSAKYDEGNVFIRKEDLARLLGTGNSLHEITILLNDDQQVDSLKKELAVLYPNLQTDSWKDIAPELDFIDRIMDEYLQIFMAIILLAMAFGIINTMLMAVLERVKELGMLMAIGMNRVRIFFMIMLETIFLTFAGVPFGLGLSILTIRTLNKTGVDLSLFSKGLANFDIDTVIYPTLNTEFYPMLIGMVAVTAFLSSIYPAYKALQLDPASAIRSI